MTRVGGSRVTAMRRLAPLAAVVALGLVGCGDSDGGSSESEQTGPTGESSSTEPSSTSSAASTWSPAPLATEGVAFDQQLHDELMAMFRRDQAGQKGGIDNEGPDARIERLKEIIAEHGWPTFDLVGKDGGDAAWIIAQHADLDPDFQAAALELLTEAAEAGQASWGNVAYLEDRVAAGNGEPQTYGTQIGCVRGKAKLATPLTQPDRVDELRAKAGLDPLDVYLAELDKICAREQKRGR